MHFRHSNQSHYGCVIPAKETSLRRIVSQVGIQTFVRGKGLKRSGFRLALALGHNDAERKFSTTFGEVHSVLVIWRTL